MSGSKEELVGGSKGETRATEITISLPAVITVKIWLSFSNAKAKYIEDCEKARRLGYNLLADYAGVQAVIADGFVHVDGPGDFMAKLAEKDWERLDTEFVATLNGCVAEPIKASLVVPLDRPRYPIKVSKNGSSPTP